jgi:hypothetical protein
MDKRQSGAPRVYVLKDNVAPELTLSTSFTDEQKGTLTWNFPESSQQQNDYRQFYPDLSMAKRGMLIKESREDRIGYRRMGGDYQPEGSEYTVQLKAKVGKELTLEMNQQDMPAEAAMLLVNKVTHQSYLLTDLKSEIKLPVTEPLMTMTAYVGDRGYLQEIQERLMPQQIQLEPNYPNPFNPITTIRYSITEATDIQLEVYNVLGQRVQTLVSQNQQPGWHVAQFDGSRLASGMYIYRLRVGSKVLTKKMMLLK